LNISMGEGTGDTLVLDTGTDLGLGSVTLNADIEVIKLATTDDNTNATFQAADISGQSFTMKSSDGTTGGTQLGFTVEAAAGTTAIDLSTLTIDQTITNAVYSTAMTAAAATGGVTITGTAVADTITGSGSADTITAGNGADSITAGAGNDSITITEATANSATDTIVFSSAATNGQDTITGFKVGTDDLTFLSADTSGAGAAGAATVATSAAAVVAGASAVSIAGDVDFTADEVVELTTTLTSNGDLTAAIDGSQLMKALSSTTTAATGLTTDNATDEGFLVAYQSGKAFVYHFDADGAVNDTAITAAELSLVATLNGVTEGTMVAGDFLLA
jgi:hypothetical protein